MHINATLLRRSKAAARPKTSRMGVEFWVVYAMLMATAIFPVLGKYGNGESGSSPLAQAVWSIVYVIAGVRLAALRSVSVPLFGKAAGVFVLVGVMFASSLWSVAPNATFVTSIELIGTTIVALYLVSRFTLDELLNVSVLTFATIALASLALIFGAPGHGREDWGSGAWSGLFSDKNNLGAAMSLGLLCSFALSLIAPGWRRVGALASMILCGVLMLGSHSTTALTSCAVALLVLVLFWLFRFSKIGSVGKFAIVVAAIVVASSLAVTGISMDSIYSSLGKNANLTGRTDFWPYLYQAIGDRPILGYGYDAFFRSAEGAGILSYYIIEAGGWTPYHAHNSFLQVMLDAGYVGLALLVFMQIVGLVRGFMMALRSLSPASALPLAIVVFLIFGSFTETYFDQYNTFAWIFFVAAMLYPVRDRIVGRSAVEAARMR